MDIHDTEDLGARTVSRPVGFDDWFQQEHGHKPKPRSEQVARRAWKYQEHQLAELAAAYHGERMRADCLFDQVAELREAVAIYMYSEGCSCCEGENHTENKDRVCELLGFPKYGDDSGYDYFAVAKAALLEEGK